ncbi:MAG: hypothetical protein JXM70_13975 [Pirellulales bacterium]|nr:hypothetical protein [Pirellulales bacterium]
MQVQNFDGPGLDIRFNDDPARFCNNGVVDNLVATRNWIGVRFDERAEYMHATRLSCYYNITGCVIHAGNSLSRPRQSFKTILPPMVRGN